MGKKKRTSAETDLQRLERIKRLVIVAAFFRRSSDGTLAYSRAATLWTSSTASRPRIPWMLDLSMDSDFEAAERQVIASKVERLLKTTFRAAAYEVFDVAMEETPRACARHGGFLGRLPHQIQDC